MQFKDQQLTDDLNLIMDAFIGAVVYIKFRMALLRFEEKALEGDTSSKEILEIVHRFAKLVKIIIEGKI